MSFSLGLEGDEPLKGSRSTHAAGTAPFPYTKLSSSAKSAVAVLGGGRATRDRPTTTLQLRPSFFFPLPARSFPPSISGIIIVGYRRPGTCSNSVSVIWFLVFKHFHWIGSVELEAIVSVDLPKSAPSDNVGAVVVESGCVVIFFVIYSPFACLVKLRRMGGDFFEWKSKLPRMFCANLAFNVIDR